MKKWKTKRQGGRDWYSCPSITLSSCHIDLLQVLSQFNDEKIDIVVNYVNARPRTLYTKIYIGEMIFTHYYV